MILYHLHNSWKVPGVPPIHIRPTEVAGLFLGDQWVSGLGDIRILLMKRESHLQNAEAHVTPKMTLSTLDALICLMIRACRNKVFAVALQNPHMHSFGIKARS
eukprot:scaffold1137_cov392-Pavlova_lutheri.AAC.25